MPSAYQRNETEEENQCLNNTITAVENKKTCCTLKRTFICCFILFVNCVICCLTVLVIMGVLFSGLSSISKYLLRPSSEFENRK